MVAEGEKVTPLLTFSPALLPVSGRSTAVVRSAILTNGYGWIWSSDEIASFEDGAGGVEWERSLLVGSRGRESERVRKWAGEEVSEKIQYHWEEGKTRGKNWKLGRPEEQKLESGN